MGKLGEAVVEVRADLRMMNADLAKAEAGIGRFVSASSGALAGLGAAVGLGAIAGIGSAIAKATMKAADLGETISKVEVVFGSASGVVKKQADSMAGAFGSVKGVILDAAANIGMVGLAAGMSQLEAAKLGSQMVKLAADCESMFNVPLDISLEKIRAGLVGESEPLRAFGVLLSEDAVKAEALRLGLAKTAAGITDQIKVIARASLIRKGLAKASGDLERTSGSTKNQFRKLMGDLENFATEFGKNFLKPMNEGIQLARELGISLDKAFSHDTNGGISEELTAVIKAFRIVNRAITGPAFKRGTTLQDVADEMTATDAAPAIQKGLPAPPKVDPAKERQAQLDKFNAQRNTGDAASAKAQAMEKAKPLLDFLRPLKFLELPQLRMPPPRETETGPRPDRFAPAPGKSLADKINEDAALEAGKQRAAKIFERHKKEDRDAQREKTAATLARTVGPEAGRKYLESAAKPWTLDKTAKPSLAKAAPDMKSKDEGTQQPKPSFASSQSMSIDEFANSIVGNTINNDPSGDAKDLAKTQADLTETSNTKLDLIVTGIANVVTAIGQSTGARVRGQ